MFGLQCRRVITLNANRFVAFGLAGVALLLSLFADFNYIYLLGFPDGSITELGYVQRRPTYIFIVVSIALSAYLVFQGVRKSRPRVLAVAIATYSFLIVVMLVLNYIFALNLDNGQGG